VAVPTPADEQKAPQTDPKVLCARAKVEAFDTWKKTLADTEDELQAAKEEIRTAKRKYETLPRFCYFWTGGDGTLIYSRYGTTRIGVYDRRACEFYDDKPNHGTGGADVRLCRIQQRNYLPVRNSHHRRVNRTKNAWCDRKTKNAYPNAQKRLNAIQTFRGTLSRVQSSLDRGALATREALEAVKDAPGIVDLNPARVATAKFYKACKDVTP
jgi:hypothetical protein